VLDVELVELVELDVGELQLARKTSAAATIISEIFFIEDLLGNITIPVM
jgi:hypothetical protein